MYLELSGKGVNTENIYRRYNDELLEELSNTVEPVLIHDATGRKNENVIFFAQFDFNLCTIRFGDYKQ
jgi:hypothetical protein